jgi:hypothetical protein
MPQIRRVNGIALDPWQTLESFPRDGRMVEIIDANGQVFLATWRNGILIDSDYEVQPTHWRQL